jgi:hypothetical protein
MFYLRRLYPNNKQLHGCVFDFGKTNLEAKGKEEPKPASLKQKESFLFIKKFLQCVVHR